MIEIIKPEKFYTPKIGSVLWDNAKYLANDWKDYPSKLFLNFVEYDSLTALDTLEISKDVLLKSKYKCPILGYDNYGTIPFCLMSEDYTKYLTKTHRQYLNDQEFTSHLYKHMYKEVFANVPNKIGKQLLNEYFPFEKLLLGSGYTSGTMPNDGHGSVKMGQMLLENGDRLGVFFWEWYNK